MGSIGICPDQLVLFVEHHCAWKSRTQNSQVETALTGGAPRETQVCAPPQPCVSHDSLRRDGRGGGRHRGFYCKDEERETQSVEGLAQVHTAGPRSEMPTPQIKCPVQTLV